MKTYPVSDFTDYVPNHLVKEVAEYLWDIGQHTNFGMDMKWAIDHLFIKIRTETLISYRKQIRSPVNNPPILITAIHKFDLYQHSPLYQALENVILLYKIDNLL